MSALYCVACSVQTASHAHEAFHSLKNNRGGEQRQVRLPNVMVHRLMLMMCQGAAVVRTHRLEDVHQPVWRQTEGHFLIICCTAFAGAHFTQILGPIPLGCSVDVIAHGYAAVAVCEVTVDASLLALR